MFYEFCGLDNSPFQFIDGWWGHCCKDHDEQGVTWESNLEFAQCLWEAGGPVLSFIGFSIVTVYFLYKKTIKDKK